MSAVEDILFAPINPKPVIDILVRPNHLNANYDWKPVSQRAIDWSIDHFPDAYVQRDFDGWMRNFHSEYSIAKIVKYGADRHMRWATELVDEKFIFGDA